MKKLVSLYAALTILPSSASAQLGYEVYALKYGELTGFPTRALVLGADSTRTSDLAMMVWLLRNPTHAILVDAGFYRDEYLKSWNVKGFVKPSEAVKKFGIPPDKITDVIITHMHWDHADGADLFPNARIWVQREEYEYYQRPENQQNTGVFPVNMAMLDKFKRAGRLRLVDGDSQQVAQGVIVYTGGRHTRASQYVGVSTGAGTAVVASDNVYLYENLDKRRPIAATWDSLSNLAAQDRMRRLVGPRGIILPGHDPQVLTRYTEIAPNVVVIR